MADDQHLDSIWKPVSEFIVDRNKESMGRWHLVCPGCGVPRVAAFNRDQADKLSDGTPRRRYKCKGGKLRGGPLYCTRSWGCRGFCEMALEQLTEPQRDLLQSRFPEQFSLLIIMAEMDRVANDVPPPSPMIAVVAHPPSDIFKRPRDPAPTGQTPPAKRTNSRIVDLSEPPPIFHDVELQLPSLGRVSSPSLDVEYTILIESD